MAQDGRSCRRIAVIFSVWTLIAVCPTRVTAADPEGETAIGNTLAVHTALLQGTDLLKRFEYKEAVHVLESQISRINGNRQYLTALRDAYRGYIDELRRENNEDEAKLYARRLAILDGKSANKTPPAEKKPLTEELAPPTKTEVKAEPVLPMKKTEADSLPSHPEPVFRANIDDPFRPENSKDYVAKVLLKDADAAFDKRQFPEAGNLYQQAYQADRAILTGKEDRMAYCKLDHVVRQLNNPPPGGLALVALEQEVRQAVELAPKLESYGKTLIARIEERRTGGETTNRQEPEAAAVAVRHREQENGWQAAETTNFRIL